LRSDGRWRVVVFAGDINELEHRRRLEKVSSRNSEFVPNEKLMRDSLRHVSNRSFGGLRQQGTILIA